MTKPNEKMSRRRMGLLGSQTQANFNKGDIDMVTQAASPKPLDEVSQIMAYEAGELEGEEVISLFQSLVDSGLAWSLQGHYGRTAADLIADGWVVDKRVKGRELARLIIEGAKEGEESC